MFSKATSMQTSFRLILRSELHRNKDLFINQTTGKAVERDSIRRKFFWLEYQVGGKVKSVYLTVCPKREHKSVFKKMFFDAKSYNEYVKNPEFIAKYPTELFDIIKEVY